MKGDGTEGKKDTIRMELKYCERCGGLWLRESGAGVVYCANCQAEIAELPVPKKKPGRVRVPVRPHTLVESYGVESDGTDDFGTRRDDASQADGPDFDGADLDGADLEAAGGAA